MKEIKKVTLNNLADLLNFNEKLQIKDQTPLNKWKMEINDAPIFRYLYRNFKPNRHLEFGTWQGQGVLYVLEECQATAWTINLLFGETDNRGSNVYGNYLDEIEEIRKWAKKTKFKIDPKANYHQTDCVGFIGRHYLKKNMGHRVNQIYCDSRKWDLSNYPSDFFDSVLIDGSHEQEIVISDTLKALQVLRRGGIILWHDYCPETIDQFETAKNVVQAIHKNLALITKHLKSLSWIYPSYILLGLKA